MNYQPRKGRSMGRTYFTKADFDNVVSKASVKVNDHSTKTFTIEFNEMVLKTSKIGSVDLIFRGSYFNIENRNLNDFETTVALSVLNFYLNNLHLNNVDNSYDNDDEDPVDDSDEEDQTDVSGGLDELFG
jgi:type I restriction-modification system DNA methylase subunit